jgi:hypothetical protein
LGGGWNKLLLQRVLILPGWQNSGPTHWQSRWELQHGFVRVQQSDWQHPLRGDWMMRLEEAVLEVTGPVVLAAHSLGCQLVAAWAGHSQHVSRVSAALLVAPPDTTRADTPPQLSSWRQVPHGRLPFPATLLYSDDDPFCNPERACAMAADWGARTQSLGSCGHVNAESGLGDWPEGLALLHALPVGDHG